MAKKHNNFEYIWNNQVDTIKEIMSSEENYMNFLKTSAYLTSNSIYDKIAIFSHNPEIKCAETFEKWNEDYGYWIKKGAKGIPTVAIKDGRLTITYLFDIEQTIEKDGSRYIWEYTEATKGILPDLLKEYDRLELENDEDRIESIAIANIKKILPEFKRNIRDDINRSMVDNFNTYEVGVETLVERAENLLYATAKYSMLERAGFDVENKFKEEDFKSLKSITNPRIFKIVIQATSSIINNSINDIEKAERKMIEEEIQRMEALSEELESKISDEKEKDIPEVVQDEKVLQNQNIDEEKGDNLNERYDRVDESGNLTNDGRRYDRDGEDRGRMLSDTGRDRGPISQPEGIHEEISETRLRSNETRVSSRSSQVLSTDGLHQGRGAVESSDGISRESDKLQEQGTIKNDEKIGNIRTAENRERNQVHGIDEQSGISIERNSERDGNLWIEEEAKEVENTSFFNAKDIDFILRNGGNSDNRQYWIVSEFSKGKDIEELASFLKETFRGGDGYILDGKNISTWYDEDGIQISYADTARYNLSEVISWNEAALRIKELLENGTYATSEVIDNAMKNEMDLLAQRLIYLKRDIKDAFEQSSLPSLNNLITGNFPTSLTNIYDNLQDKEFRENLSKEFKLFRDVYNENPEIMFYDGHDIDKLYTHILELDVVRENYTSDMVKEDIKAFITDDEIDINLMKDNAFFDANQKTYNFFKNNENLQERAEFLRSAYGTGGTFPALSGSKGSGQWNGPKGIRFEKENCEDVFLTWSEVAKRVDKLIQNDRYPHQEIEEEKAPERLVYKKEDPENLTPEDFLENVPELYSQKNIENSEKVVHAVYFIPFKNKTWYLTEFDKETGDAFGLVAGEFVEWGYFNILELEEVGAVRDIMRDYPQTFRELRDTELTNQFFYNELKTLFGAEFADNIEEIQSLEPLEDLEENTQVEMSLEEIPLGEMFRKQAIESRNEITDEIDFDITKIFEDNLVLSVTTDEKDFKKLIPYFKDFEFRDGSTMNEYNPFESDKDAFTSGLISMKFYINNDNELRVTYATASDIMYESNVDTFIENLNIMIENADMLTNEKVDSKDYWVVEDNETLGGAVKDYSGIKLTKELIDEIKTIDESIRIHNDTLGKDEHGNITDQYEGYYKFYFDHIVDGETIEHIRVDIGDGNEYNNKIFNQLYEEVKIYDSIQDTLNSNNEITEEISRVNSIRDIAEPLFETLKSDEDLQRVVLKAREILGNNTLADFSGVFQREYAKVMREVAQRQGNLPDDMKSLDEVKKLRVQLEHRYNDYLSELSAEKENAEDVKDKIAVKVGYYYAVVDKEKVDGIDLAETGTKVYPREDNFLGKVYPLYKGKTFEESTKIDKLFDEIAVNMKEANLSDLNDLFYLNNQGLYEIDRDTVTEEKTGYDFNISSFGEQFPDYYNDLYVINENLEINGGYQNIAFINKENEIRYNVQVPEEERSFIEETRNKKEIISKLIAKEIEDHHAYSLNYSTEEFILERKELSEGTLKDLDHIKDSVDGKKGYEAELVLDFLEKELKQVLKYNGFLISSNSVISYPSYSDMLEDIDYFLDDKNRERLIEAIIEENKEANIEKPESKLKFDVGEDVIYKDKIYTISKFDNFSNMKTVELKARESYLGGFISDSEIVAYKNDDDLDIMLDKIASLDLDDYDLEGLEVIFDNKNYKITGNVFKHDGMSKLSLKSTTDNVLSDIMYTDQRPVPNIYARKSELDSYKMIGKDFKEIGLNKEDIKEEIKLTASERLNNNVEALSMLRRVEKGERELDESAREVMSKYVGWGGLADVFDESKTGQWQAVRDFLNENLTEEEINKIKESTLTAFYTPKTVINAIYNYLDSNNITEGNVLEPSCGIGNFFKADSNLKYTGIELDNLTARFAKQIHSNVDIINSKYEKTNIANNSFDIALGNVPFGDFKVYDPEYNKNNFLIHDYFFEKTLDKVRPGGVIALITSSGTLDKENESVRRYIAERADLLGAIRLPNDTFKGEAGTEVVSDIIFLQKREDLNKEIPSWVHIGENEDGFRINQYFIDNPNMLLGELEEVTGRFGKELTLNPSEIPLTISLNEAISNVLKVENYKASNKEVKITTGKEDVDREFTIENDNIYFVERGNKELVELKPVEKDRMLKMMEIRDIAKDILSSQVNGISDEELAVKREFLNTVYDEFVSSYGRLNDDVNSNLFEDDKSSPLLLSLELFDEENNFEYVGKSDIFTKRTLKAAETVEKVDSAQEALILSINERGKVDFDYMERLSSLTREELIKELKGEIFLNINYHYEVLTYPFEDAENGSEIFDYVTADEYLSGNIRNKIKILDKYSESLNQGLELTKKGGDISQDSINRIETELEKINSVKKSLVDVLPEYLHAEDIEARVGTTWIPVQYYNQFIKETFDIGVNDDDSSFYSYLPSVKFSEYTGEYLIENKGYYSNHVNITSTFGTERLGALNILEQTLNLKEVEIRDKTVNPDGKEIYVVNQQETFAAREKQDLIKNEFKEWLWKDPNRKNELEQIYNEKFNSIRLREFDGSNLNFPGMNANIELRPHQRDAIARGLFGGNTLLAHAVGAGKTFEMATIAMESKRLGLCTKSMIVVPNHLTKQIGTEIQNLYPLANVLITGTKDFEKKNRQKFCSKIATNNYDVVVIGHSQFEKIPLSKERLARDIELQIEEITNFIDEEDRLIKEKHGLYYSSSKSFSIKRLEKTKKNLEAKLEKLLDTPKDDTITFEELGIDKLFVDEAHSFKNLYLYTKMQNVAGIGQTDAKKSSDMYSKVRYMDEITDGKGTVFATGTPISNSMTEMYTMQRYLQGDMLKEMGLQNFDAWASTFGETINSIELKPEGTGYRARTRFSRFFNVPELVQMFKEVADIKTSDMLDLPVPEAEYNIITTKPTDIQKSYLNLLTERAERVRSGAIDSRQDNMLKITNDGRKIALDQRVMNENLPDDPNSKVNTCINNIHTVWQDTIDTRSTQLVFCDISTPSDEFNVYDDIKDKLINKGIPREEIAFIHDAKNDKQKDELFKKVREGEVRVLIGSTQKMGTGTNCQDKLITLHDLDCPWRPSDLEQRLGRIVRQGNENEKVKIFRYITENTFDAYLWQTVENKQKFISQIMTSKTPERTAMDADEVTLSFAEIKALATGNPLIKEKMDLENELTKLKAVNNNFIKEQRNLDNKANTIFPQDIKRLEKSIKGLKEDIETVKNNKSEDFPGIKLKEIQYKDKKEAVERLQVIINDRYDTSKELIGIYKGFNMYLSYNLGAKCHELELQGRITHRLTLGSDPYGNLQRIENTLDKIESKLETATSQLEGTKQQLAIVIEELNKPNPHLAKIAEKEARLKEVTNTINAEETNPSFALDLDQDNDGIVDRLDADFRNPDVETLGDYFNKEKITMVAENKEEKPVKKNHYER